MFGFRKKAMTVATVYRDDGTLVASMSIPSHPRWIADVGRGYYMEFTTLEDSPTLRLTFPSILQSVPAGAK